MIYFSSTEPINNQRKKDKDDGSNDTLSVTTKQSLRKTKKDEHMSKSVDTNVDTDDLTNPSLDEVSRTDGRRLKSKDYRKGKEAIKRLRLRNR